MKVSDQSENQIEKKNSLLPRVRQKIKKDKWNDRKDQLSFIVNNKKWFYYNYSCYDQGLKRKEKKGLLVGS